MKYIGYYEGSLQHSLGVNLEIYECECGFHLGVDGKYLDFVFDQVGDDVDIACPSCGLMFHIEAEEPA